MKLRLVLTMLCGLMVAMAAPASAQTAAERRQLDWALERGRLLFALDRAAWVATDDMLERVTEAQRQGARGYIVDRDEHGLLAIFYAREGERLVALYRGRIGSNGIAAREIFPPGQRPELAPRQQRLARALEQLRSTSLSLQMCSRSAPNFAAIPPDTPDGPIDIYVMTPQSDANEIPAGGHHRLTLDRNGRITAQRRFTNSCIGLQLAAAGQLRSAGLVLTHLLDPIPTEIHVFSAMAARLPIYVSAGESVWEVTGEQIRFVDRIEPRR